MRRLPSVIAVLAVIPLAVLAGCSSKSSSTPSSTSTPSATTSTVKNTVPNSQLPTITGGFGEEPTIAYPANPHYVKPTATATPTPTATASSTASASATPSPTSTTDSPYLAAPKDLQIVELTKGTGPAIQTGQMLVVNYWGAIWGKTTSFDDSWKRNAPLGFTVGVSSPSSPLATWNTVLPGYTIGSRLMLVMPPADGYGSAGNSQAGISGTDTLVFVVDVVAQYPAGVTIPSSAKPTGRTTTAVVTGNPGAVPKISVPSGAAQPAKLTTTVIDEGSGPAIQSTDNVVLQYAAVNWDNSTAGDTWTGDGLQQGSMKGSALVPLGPNSGDTVFNGLVGVPVGSRVVIQLPAQSASNSPAVAVVVDVIANFPTLPKAPVL